MGLQPFWGCIGTLFFSNLGKLWACFDFEKNKASLENKSTKVIFWQNIWPAYTFWNYNEVGYIVLCLWYGSVVVCHVIFFPKAWEWGTGNVYLLFLDPYFGHMLKGNHCLCPIPIMGVADASQHYHGSQLTYQNFKRPCYHATVPET